MVNNLKKNDHTFRLFFSFFVAFRRLDEFRIPAQNGKIDRHVVPAALWWWPGEIFPLPTSSPSSTGGCWSAPIKWSVTEQNRTRPTRKKATSTLSDIVKVFELRRRKHKQGRLGWFRSPDHLERHLFRTLPFPISWKFFPLKSARSNLFKFQILLNSDDLLIFYRIFFRIFSRTFLSFSFGF